MKSTYIILGIEWDRKPLPSHIPKFVEKMAVDDYSISKNLLDYEKYERKIDISELLSNESEELEKALEKVKDCDILHINIDYEPRDNTKDVILFYGLRVLQIYSFIDDKLKNTYVDIMASERIKNICEKYWKEKNLTDITYML